MKALFHLKKLEATMELLKKMIIAMSIITEHCKTNAKRKYYQVPRNQKIRKRRNSRKFHKWNKILLKQQKASKKRLKSQLCRISMQEGSAMKLARSLTSIIDY